MALAGVDAMLMKITPIAVLSFHLIIIPLQPLLEPILDFGL